MSRSSSQLTQSLVAQGQQSRIVRDRAIQGDQQSLRKICNSIAQLLKQTDSKNHHTAYRQTNQLLLSAKPEIVTYVDNQLLTIIAEVHCRNDLDQYIILWKRLLIGKNIEKYPKLTNCLKNLKVQNEHRQLSPQFNNLLRKFKRNYGQLFEEQVQFFSDISQHSIPLTMSVSKQEYIPEIIGSIEASSSQISKQMKQIEQLKASLEKGNANRDSISMFMQKAKRFLALKPKSLDRELSITFNRDRVWVQQFISSIESFLRNEGSNLQQKAKERKEDGIGQNKQQIKQISIHQIKFEPQVQNIEDASTKRKSRTILNKQLSYKLPVDNEVKNSQIGNYEERKVPNTQSTHRFPSSKFPTKIENLPNYGYQSSTVPYSFTKISQNAKTITNKIQKKNQQTQKSNSKKLNNSKSDTSLMAHNSKLKPKIFKIQGEPRQENLLVTVHRRKVEQSQERANIIGQYYNLQVKQQPHFLLESANIKNQLLEEAKINPQNYENKSINVKSSSLSKRSIKLSEKAIQYQQSDCRQNSLKKLSDIRSLKTQRQQKFVKYEIYAPEPYLLSPFTINFSSLQNFNQFRRNCFQIESILLQTAQLIIIFAYEQIGNYLIKVHLTYQKKQAKNLKVETLYRIPRCLQVEKLGKVKKNWVLAEREQHTFLLKLKSFPLEPSFLNIKISSISEEQIYNNHNPIVSVFPLTFLNFLRCLIVNQYQWQRNWAKWQANQFTHIERYIKADKSVTQSNLKGILKDFIPLSKNIESYGGLFKQNINDLSFLLKVQDKNNGILRITLLCDRKIIDSDQMDYTTFCVDSMALLLFKIERKTFENQN